MTPPPEKKPEHGRDFPPGNRFNMNGYKRTHLIFSDVVPGIIIILVPKVTMGKGVLLSRRKCYTRPIISG